MEDCDIAVVEWREQKLKNGGGYDKKMSITRQYTDKL
jgi:hypothetical protein